MKKLIPLLIWVPLLLVSCRKEPVKEIASTYPDGSEKLVRLYVIDGQIKEKVLEVAYWPNHKKFYEGGYKDNFKEGKWTSWYENGNKWSEGHYSRGVDDGEKTAYFENGNKRFQGIYVKGKMVGEWRFWNDDGVLMKKINYGSAASFLWVYILAGALLILSAGVFLIFYFIKRKKKAKRAAASEQMI
jgi:antitoxin component YwqK of YwqJK toxin-antitoxin module